MRVLHSQNRACTLEQHTLTQARHACAGGLQQPDRVLPRSSRCCIPGLTAGDFCHALTPLSIKRQGLGRPTPRPHAISDPTILSPLLLLTSLDGGIAIKVTGVGVGSGDVAGTAGSRTYAYACGSVLAYAVKQLTVLYSILLLYYTLHLQGAGRVRIT